MLRQSLTAATKSHGLFADKKNARNLSARKPNADDGTGPLWWAETSLGKSVACFVLRWPEI